MLFKFYLHWNFYILLLWPSLCLEEYRRPLPFSCYFSSLGFYDNGGFLYSLLMLNVNSFRDGDPLPPLQFNIHRFTSQSNMYLALFPMPYENWLLHGLIQVLTIPIVFNCFRVYWFSMNFIFLKSIIMSCLFLW